MGELTKSQGDQWRYLITDFSGGWLAPGPSTTHVVDQAAMVDDRYGVVMKGFDSYVGELSPMVGDSKLNNTAFSATGNIDLIFPYIPPYDAGDNSYLELFVRGNTLYSVLVTPTGIGSQVTEGGLGATTATRYAAQSLGYCWIARSNGQMFRFNKNNPGGGTTVSNAGTKSPTNAPTVGVPFGSGASLTSGTGYRYRYAWEYGTSRELGMGWKQGAASAIATPTGTQFITVTMDASPPTSWSHVVSRALFRNTTFFPDNFFLVTRTPYSGSALSTKYEDGTADTLIEDGEECDPPQPQDKTVTTGVYSELLPPTFTFCAIHEGRLWGLDAWVSTTRYPSRAVYSRISPVGPAPRWDQFDTFATVEATPADMGAPSGLVSWMSNLYALFERGITVLSTDPGTSRLPTFAVVVAGRGCVSPRSIAITPFGMAMISAEGPILFNGGPKPILLSEAISAHFQSSGSTAGLRNMVGGYDAKRQEYSFAAGTGGTGPVWTYNFNRKRWNDTKDESYDNDAWSYAASVGQNLHYAITSTTASAMDYIYIRKGGTVNNSLTASTALRREYWTFYLDCGMPYVQKKLRWVRLRFAELSTSNGGSTLTVNLANDDVVSSVTSNFPTTQSRIFTFSYSGQNFTALQLQIVLPHTEAAGILTFPGRIVAIEICFEGNPERIYSKAVV